MNLKVGNKKINYLVETALLGQGILSITNEEILNVFPRDSSLAWVEQGNIKIGFIDEFLKIRGCKNFNGRYDGNSIKQLSCKSNGYLTASGTMAVAELLDIPIVVSAGLGGIGDIRDEKLCLDLPYIVSSKVILVGTSFKDMLDIKETLKWIFSKGSKVVGNKIDYCDGYIFNLEKYKLSGRLTDYNGDFLSKNIKLVLNEIPSIRRIQNLDILNYGIEAGKKAEKRGEIYHPAVNAYFDDITNGKSSKIQLYSLIDNVRLAKKLYV